MSNETKHTPGPWDAENEVVTLSNVVGEKIVALSAPGRTYEEQLANAKLIAAAPELLAILDELDGTFEQQVYQERSHEDFDASDDREYSVNITAKQLRVLSAALTKATT